jgi:uncharacterized membrane-anchored protein YjiN (DUF445 family)
MALSTPGTAHLKDANLARAKSAATGMLAIAGMLYVVATIFTPRYPALAYLAATCEAGMVGALADWFAVVALFRHPLGVPLPHTAILPKNKARIAQGLGEFIQEQFLSRPALVAKIREFDPAAQLANWLRRDENAAAVSRNVTGAIAYGIGALDDGRVRDFLQRMLAGGLSKLDAATLLAGVLEILTEKRRHHALLDQALAATRDLLGKEETREFLRKEIAAQMPFLKWVNQVVHLDEKAAGRLLEVAILRLGEVLDDPDHALRHRFDEFAWTFIEKLKADPDTRARVEQLRDEMLRNPALAQYVSGLWTEFRAWMEADLAQSDSSVKHRIVIIARALGERIAADAGIRAWINEQVIAVAPGIVEEHRLSVGRFIERQINEWNDATLVRELERNIGPDLQYIRINGTLVGGGAGLAIYSLTRFLAGSAGVG